MRSPEKYNSEHAQYNNSIKLQNMDSKFFVYLALTISKDITLGLSDAILHFEICGRSLTYMYLAFAMIRDFEGNISPRQNTMITNDKTFP